MYLSESPETPASDDASDQDRNGETHDLDINPNLTLSEDSEADTESFMGLLEQLGSQAIFEE